MTPARKMGAAQAVAAGDALLAPKVDAQQAQRAVIAKRFDTSKPAGHPSGFLPFLAALFGIPK
jgi:hypothetical protein